MMIKHESAFHAIYPEDLADKLCEVVDLSIKAAKGLEENEVEKIHRATGKVLGGVIKKYYDEVVFHTAPAGLSREEKREFILSKAKEETNND